MSINNKEKAVKPAYEDLTCSLTEVETQGVLCASNGSEDGSLTGGLGPYTGSAL